MTRFGIWDQVHARPGVGAADLFDERLEDIRLAESLGLDDFWFSEHVFNRDYSLTPAPQLLIAAAAPQTSRLVFGVMAHILPLRDPLRLAAECAMLDQLTRGRLRIGIGRGARPDEYGYYAVAREESRERFAEAGEVFLRLLAGETVSFEGRYVRCHEARLAPDVYQQPFPPVFVATTGDETVQWAAAHGLGIARGGNEALAALRQALDLYRTTRAEVTDTDPGAVPVPHLMMRTMYVAPTDEQAHAEARPYLFRQFEHLTGLSRPGVEPTNEAFADLLEASRGVRMGRWTYDEMVAADLVLAGSPDSVSRQIQRLVQAVPADTLIAHLTFGGMPPDLYRASLRLYGETVLPKVREALGTREVTRVPA